MAAEQAAPTWITGHCYCGGVQFRVRADPPTSRACFCHCESCRRAHAAPLYQVVYVPDACMEITAGDDLLTPFSRSTSSIVRSFCRVCGSRVCNRSPQQPELGVGFFPALLVEEAQHALPAAFRATDHYLSHEAVLDLAKPLDEFCPRA